MDIMYDIPYKIMKNNIAPRHMESNKICVKFPPGNTITMDTVYQLFTEYGKIKEVSLEGNICKIKYETTESGMNAKKSMADTNITHIGVLRVRYIE